MRLPRMRGLLFLALAGILLGFPGPAPAQAPSDSLLLQAVQQQISQENYEEALVLLGKSWQQGPRTPEKAFLMGKVNRRLLRYKDARRCLEDAVNLKPTYWEARVLLADTLIALDQPAQAEPQLLAVQKAGYEPEQTAFLLGMACFKLKKYSQAADYFRQAQKNPQLAQEAKFQESMALAAQDRIGEARRAMAESIALNPGTQTAGLAQGFVAAMDRRLKDERRFRFYGSAGLDYDSNVTLQPGSVVAAQQVAGKGDMVYTQTANLEYNLMKPGPFALWGQYNYYQNFHRQLTSFNLWSNTFGLAPSYAWPNARLWMAATYNYTEVAEAKYYTGVTVNPTYLYLPNPKIGLEAGFRYSQNWYWTPSGIPQDDRTGDSFGGSLAVYYFLKEQQGFFTARFAYDRFNTNGSNWDNSAYRFMLAVLYPVTDRLSLRGYAELAFQPFDNVFVGNNLAATNPRRNDTTVSFGLETTYALYKGLELNLHYYYVKDNSNIVLYDYSRHIVGGQLGYRY